MICPMCARLSLGDNDDGVDVFFRRCLLFPCSPFVVQRYVVSRCVGDGRGRVLLAWKQGSEWCRVDLGYHIIGCEKFCVWACCLLMACLAVSREPLKPNFFSRQALTAIPLALPRAASPCTLTTFLRLHSRLGDKLLEIRVIHVFLYGSAGVKGL